MRPSAATSGTDSVSCTALTLEEMMPTASSTDSIGPPKAKQSSDSCAMPSGFRRRHRQQIVQRDRRTPQHGDNRRDIVEMGSGKRCFNGDVADNADDTGIIREQERLAIIGAMHLDLAVRLVLVAFDHNPIDPHPPPWDTQPGAPPAA